MEIQAGVEIQAEIIQIKEPIRTQLIAKHGKIGIMRLAFALTLDWLIK